jgi:hypothetical protein
VLLGPRLVDSPALAVGLLLERARGEPREAGRASAKGSAGERAEDERPRAVGKGDEKPDDRCPEQKKVGQRLQLADEGDDLEWDVWRLREERDVLRRGVWARVCRTR